MTEEVIVYQCSNVGVAGITDVHIRRIGVDEYEARVGIAIMGSTNMDEAGFEACGYNPFHEKFRDNWASGTGATEAEALDALKADMRQTADSLWAF